MSTPRSPLSARSEVRQVAPKLVTHLAFYAGWPAAMTAGRVVRKAFEGAQP